MLRVVFGNDEALVRKSALDYFKTNEVVRIEATGFLEGQLISLAEGSSLFGGTAEYLIDTPSDNSIFFEELLDAAESIAASEHLFVVIDKALLAADKKVLTKYASSIDEYKKAADGTFNQFAITDAISQRDKRLAWLLLQDAKSNNIAIEEVIGLVWWQLKTMRLAAVTNNAAEAGMKDYPYKKAKSALQKFPIDLVVKKSHELTKLYHDSRWGKGDLGQQFEMWVLSL